MGTVDGPGQKLKTRLRRDCGASRGRPRRERTVCGRAEEWGVGLVEESQGRPHSTGLRLRWTRRGRHALADDGDTRKKRRWEEAHSPSSQPAGSGSHRPLSDPARSWACGARPPWRTAPAGHRAAPLSCSSCWLSRAPCPAPLRRKALVTPGGKLFARPAGRCSPRLSRVAFRACAVRSPRRRKLKGRISNWRRMGFWE